MANVEYMKPIKGLHGKVQKQDNVYFREMYGKSVAIRMIHPRTEKDFSEHEKAYRKSFGEMSKEASRINKDETQVAKYNDWKEKGYRSRYRYILVLLVKNAVNNCEAVKR